MIYDGNMYCKLSELHKDTCNTVIKSTVGWLRGELEKLKDIFYNKEKKNLKEIL